MGTVDQGRERRGEAGEGEAGGGKKGAGAKVKSVLMSVLVWVVVLLIPVAMVGGGGWMLYERAVGTRVEAKVLACEWSGNWAKYAPTMRESCVAEWVVDGETVVGPIEGGNGGWDVGKVVDATVRGDTAYSRSLVLPIVLILLGLPFLAAIVVGRLKPPKKEDRPEGAG